MRAKAASGESSLELSRMRFQWWSGSSTEEMGGVSRYASSGSNAFALFLLPFLETEANIACNVALVCALGAWLIETHRIC